MKRVAVDEVAKKYWEDYYMEYGRAWIRDIPRRIKAAVDEERPTRTASTDEGYKVIPLAHKREGSTLTWEGLYSTPSERLLFAADFDLDGNIAAFKPLDLP